MNENAVSKINGNTGKNNKKTDSNFSENEGVELALDLVNRTRHCLVGTNGEDGFPNIKTMTNRKHEGLKRIWFKTETLSRRVQQLRRDNNACVYFLDSKVAQGLMLLGNMEILQDVKSKKLIWTEEDNIFNPIGVEDPEILVLCFTAVRGNFVDARQNKGLTFEIE